MSSYVILDTHVLLWSLLKPEELTDKVKSKIEQAQKRSKVIVKFNFALGDSHVEL
jgi:PIN domain nuclease of toxin-antitoxin system